MVGDIISERWAALSRNGWAASFRNHGRLAPESARAVVEERLGFWVTIAGILLVGGIVAALYVF
jgi:hypothetical protein